MKVLFAASEVAPIVKMGGLGDVIGALPKALSALKIDCDVIAPFYTTVDFHKYPLYKHLDLPVTFGGKTYTSQVFRGKLPKSDVDIFLIKQDEFFDIKKGYIVNEVVPYSFFCRAVVSFVKEGFNTYDIIHAHDWHTGMLPHLLTDELGNSKPPVVFTIHNISYQGNAEMTILKDMDVEPANHPTVLYDIQDGFLNFMQEALMNADYISTVSPSYASEILYNDISGDLSSILYDRRSRLTGILNGIDYDVMHRDFDATNWQSVKQGHKSSLLAKLGLVDDNRPLFSYISRLDPNQKGIDIMYDCIEPVVKEYGTFVLLGTGDPTWESKLRDLAVILNAKYGNHTSINIQFDTKLADEIYLASDFFFVPSRFEPCGLTQMMAMFYGALPIVRDTGGLKDSVIDSVNGFKFKTYSSEELLTTIGRAMKFFNNKPVYEKMVQVALEADYSWGSSALEYKKLYQNILKSGE
jgi:starch synthase